MRREVRFENALGTTLAGALELPAGRVRGVALFAHCFTCSAQSHGARRVSLALAAAGIATLRFDFTGLGRSGGDFADSHFGANVEDLIAAAAHLEATVGAPAILIGHSLGGAAVIAAAGRLPSVRAVVTIGAPFDPAHVLHQLGSSADAVAATGMGEVTIAGRSFAIRRDFLDAVAGQDQAGRLAGLKRALLVLHAPGDTIVGIDNARRIFEAARHPKSFIVLDGADHLLTDAAHAAYAAAIVATWVEPYLPPAQTIDPVPEGRVRVTAGDGKFVQIVDSAGHSFLADEPVGIGGGDLGPTPYDLLLAALGTCTAMTLKIVAARENIPLTGVSVELRHARHHADDSAAAMAERPRLEVLTRAISPVGDLTEAQRTRLLSVADRCPVHRTIESGPRIETILTPPAAPAAG